MFDQQFYNSLIKKYVILFGSLFTNIYIQRSDSANNEIADIKVPIQYSPKDKMFARLLGDPNLDRQYAVLLPRMSFEIATPGFTYDPQRKLPSTNRYVAKNPNDLNKVLYQYTPVPYNILFNLSIYVKSVEDGLKILEQIMPYFNPDFTPTVHLIPEMGEKRQIPIEMSGGPVMSDIYSGGFKERRMIHWEIGFTMRAWFFGPVQTAPIIKFANVTSYASYGNTADPSTSAPIMRTFTQPGLLANGSPTTNSAASIPVVEIGIDSDFGFVESITDLEV